MTDAPFRIEPTEAEVRASRISIGLEAVGRLRKLLTCPCGCGKIPHPGFALLVRLIEDGYIAHREMALAQHAAIQKLKGEKA